MNILVSELVGSPVIKLAQSTQSKDKIDTANMTGIMDRCFSVIEVVQNFDELLACVNWAVDIQAGEVNINDLRGKLAVLGQPDIDGRRLGYGAIERQGVCTKIAAERNGYPLGGVAGVVYLKLGQIVWVDWEFVMPSVKLKRLSNDFGDTKVLCESACAGHVVSVGIHTFDSRGALGSGCLFDS